MQDVQHVVRMCQPGSVADGLRVLHGPLAPPDRLPEPALAETDASVRDQQLGPLGKGPFGIVHRERAGVPAQRLRVPAGVLADHALLHQQAGLVVAPATDQPTGSCVRVGCRSELPDPLVGVAERLGRRRDLRLLDVEEVAGGVQRPAVEVGRLGVGPLRLRARRGEERVAPGVLVALGVEEVQREQLGLLVAADRPLEDRVADAAVQVTASPERQALVGDIPEQRVREPDVLRAGPREEFVEVVPVGLPGQLVADNRSGEFQGERLAEHRDGPQERSAVRR